MAVLSFDGADDWVRGNTTGAWNTTWTLALIVSPEGTGGFRSMFGMHSASQMAWELYVTGSDGVNYYDDASSATRSGLAVNITDDFIVVINRTSGTTTPRSHRKNLTAATAWTHQDFSGTVANPRSASGGYFKIGNFDNSPGTPGSADDDYEGDIGLAGFWDGISMSDGQVEALSTNSRTSDWYTHAAGTPTFLTELTSTSPTDIGTAGITLAVTGATATGTNPAGWTFDGTGSAPAEKQSFYATRSRGWR